MKKILFTLGALTALGTLASCSGRTADNMVPTGETVEVVIPTADVAMDSVIASGSETDSIL
ncbi:MAG: hypothetical protein HDR80_09090 [Bacteroides sp.]|nr:hypothetical protein [Bacteroides sp.]